MSMEKFLAGVIVFIGFVIMVFFLSGLAALPVMLLWNWLIPDIFHLRSIDFWEAWGLTWFCSILFKGSSSSK